MGNIGSSELLLILVLALLLLGPRRLPEVGANLGRMLRRFRQASRELRDEIDVERTLRLDDPDDTPVGAAPAATQARSPTAPPAAPGSPAGDATAAAPPVRGAVPPDAARDDAAR
jgi:TatA/E family protein of Tat protein translocase